MRGLWLLIAAVPLLEACNVYRPVVTPDPHPGARLVLDLNDQGRTALVTAVGPDANRVEGTLLSDSGGEYLVRVADVIGRAGARVKWNGETVSLRQDYVSRVRERRLSGGRTAFALAGLLGAVVGVMASTNLVGFGGGGDERSGEGQQQ